MNTRKDDLDRLEEVGRKDLVEKIYKQSQNPEIERLRKLLIDAHRRRDFRMIELIGEQLSKIRG